MRQESCRRLALKDLLLADHLFLPNGQLVALSDQARHQAPPQVKVRLVARSGRPAAHLLHQVLDQLEARNVLLRGRLLLPVHAQQEAPSALPRVLRQRQVTVRLEDQQIILVPSPVRQEGRQGQVPVAVSLHLLSLL